MDIKNDNIIYLTFKTTKAVSETLKIIAKGLNKTQPELINEICIDFIEYIDEIAKKDLQENGYDISKLEDKK